MSKRKQYIVNKKFQLKATFTVIGFIFIIVAILTTLIGVSVIDGNSRIAEVVRSQQEIGNYLSVPSPEMSEASQRLALELGDKHTKNISTLNRLIRFNMILIWVMVAVVFLQGLLLFFVLIRQTHRIAGPLYVMSRHMREIINGKYPDHLRPLRKTDLLKDFYATLRRNGRNTQSRQG
jgi:hypothetical protein